MHHSADVPEPFLLGPGWSGADRLLYSWHCYHQWWCDMVQPGLTHHQSHLVKHVANGMIRACFQPTVRRLHPRPKARLLQGERLARSNFRHKHSCQILPEATLGLDVAPNLDFQSGTKWIPVVTGTAMCIHLGPQMGVACWVLLAPRVNQKRQLKRKTTKSVKKKAETTQSWMKGWRRGEGSERGETSRGSGRIERG